MQAPPNLSDDLAPLLAAGIDDWGGVSPVTADHVNPERAWPALDVLRARHGGGGPRAGAPAHHLPRVRPRPRALARPRAALRRARLLRRRGPGAGGPLVLGRGGEPAGARRARSRGGGAARRPARRRGLGRARGPGRRRPRPGGRGGRDRHAVLGAGPRAAPGGRGGRRPAPRHRRRHRHLRAQPQHQLHQRVHVQVPLLRVLQGPALAEPPRRALPARARRGDAARGRGRGGGRDRGLPPGRHPPELRRRLLPARARGGPRRVGAHPHPRLHRARGDRGGAALGGRPGRVPDAAQGGRAQDAAGHGGRDPRRRGARRALPRQGLDRRVARGAPHRALGRPALEHHHHVRLGRAAGELGPPHRAHTCAPARDGRLHRVRAPAVRAHGDADLPPAPVPARADVPRGAADARRGADRLPGGHRQHPGELGQDGGRGGAPGALAPGPTTSGGR